MMSGWALTSTPSTSRVAGEGKRSTSAVGRAVVADALRGADPTGALDAEQETNWRSGYLLHFRRLVEAGLASRAACLSIADAGLASLHGRMTVADEAGDERPLAEWAASDPAHPLETVEVTGTAAPERGSPCPSRASGSGATRSASVSSPGSRPV